VIAKDYSRTGIDHHCNHFGLWIADNHPPIIVGVLSIELFQLDTDKEKKKVISRGNPLTILAYAKTA
jgi:hypothetical protein